MDIWAKIPVLAGMCSFVEALKRICFLAFPVPRGHAHFFGLWPPSRFFKANNVASFCSFFPSHIFSDWLQMGNFLHSLRAPVIWWGPFGKFRLISLLQVLSLITSTKCSQVTGIRMWTFLWGHYSAYYTHFMLFLSFLKLDKNHSEIFMKSLLNQLTVPHL